jgi:hypothetical protein
MNMKNFGVTPAYEPSACLEIVLNESEPAEALEAYRNGRFACPKPGEIVQHTIWPGQDSPSIAVVD